ncbi:Biotin/lipoyl attachment protein [Geodia barretti]|uniref:Biotin/lipoyl attachment protein n=1 Tax=Geodia barretti TaxID=519541 RepID=A0AA35QTU3_GEOBA|nr:Biotin/lipoyl attachment protein [Geodia barretti]
MREVYPVSGEAYRYRIEERDSYFTFELEEEIQAGIIPSITLGIESQQTGEGLCRTESGRTYPFAWAWVGPELHLWLDGDLFVYQLAEVLVLEGDHVERNQTVIVMESMKMELVITVPRSGVVRRVAVEPGQQVDRGMRLLELAPEEE